MITAGFNNSVVKHYGHQVKKHVTMMGLRPIKVLSKMKSYAAATCNFTSAFSINSACANWLGSRQLLRDTATVVKSLNGEHTTVGWCNNYKNANDWSQSWGFLDCRIFFVESVHKAVGKWRLPVQNVLYLQHSGFSVEAMLPSHLGEWEGAGDILKPCQ